MAAIITVCRDDLGLPVVDPLYVLLHKDRNSHPTLFPSDVLASAAGRTIHINLQKTTGASWGALLGLLAHEYGHNLEDDLSIGKLRGTRWFSEGFAEWIAAKVVDALGWQNYQLTVRRAKLELMRDPGLVPSLSSVADGQGWHSLLNKPKGYIRTYPTAFLAVDRLIEKRGVASAIRYIKSGDFHSSFGETLTEYKIDLGNVELWKGDQASKISIPKPELKVGYQWIYDEKIPGKTHTVVTEVIKEESLNGVPVLVFKDGEDEQLYTKDTLGLVSTIHNGRLKAQRVPPNKVFDWPLQAAKTWKNTYTIQNLEKGKTDKINRFRVVASFGDITVPAGKFETAKIESYDNESGRLMSEYWYSPTAKWIVKSISYGSGDGYVQEQELRSFKVDRQKR